MGGCGGQQHDAAPPPLPGSCFSTVFTLALSEMTNEKKSQAKSALAGLLGYVPVKYKTDKMIFCSRISEVSSQAKWKTELPAM